MKCSIEGCDGQVRSLGMCKSHYDKHHRAAMSSEQRERNRLRRLAYYAGNKAAFKIRRDKVSGWMKDYCKQRYLAKKEEIKARVKAYARDNKDVIRSKRAEYYSRNAERLRAKAKLYRASNIDKVRDWKAAGRKRDRIAEGSHDYLQLKGLRQKQRNKCAICKKPFGKKYHKDHIVPLFLGGSNYIENIQYLCALCNTQKNKKDPIQFMQEKGYLL